MTAAGARVVRASAIRSRAGRAPLRASGLRVSGLRGGLWAGLWAGLRVGLRAALPTGALLALLCGCAAPAINTADRANASAQAQDSRVQWLVLHFTGETLADSLRLLTGPTVSAHYLLSDETPPQVYPLVDENRRAWHAGDSAWRGQTPLNASSIGIEIVNPGPLRQADGSIVFAPYPAAQIDVLIPLMRAIMARHGIRGDRILGHSDIAPQRKVDPGPAFPWQRLAAAGLVAWPDAARVARLRPRFEAALPSLAWFAQALATVGYSVPASGAPQATPDAAEAGIRRVIAAFQMKYRPARFDGQPDAETAALLQSLLEGLAP